MIERANARAHACAVVEKNAVTISDVTRVLGYNPASTSRGRGWRGLTVDTFRELPDRSVRYPALDHHLISYCTGGKSKLRQNRGEVVHDGVFSSGMLVMMPSGYDSLWEGQVPGTVRLRVPHDLVSSAAEQLSDASMQVELLNVFEARDPVLERIVQILAAELDQQPHPAQGVLTEALSCAVAAHILRRYNAFSSNRPESRASLAAKEIERLTCFIEDNLDRTISLSELAGIANVSRFHFARIFRQATGMSAMNFVEQSRIRRAQVLLSESNLPLVEVALMTGFSDQSHFTRRFSRHVGTTPGVYARERGRRRLPPLSACRLAG
jgi:AraC family transcriptional regulator